MNSYLNRRSELSDALLSYLMKQLTVFPIMRSDGSLLTPEAEKITQSTPLEAMTIVQKFYFGQIDEPEHYIALVITRTADGHPQVSIHTQPDKARHIVKVSDSDTSASIEILKRLIDETISEIKG